MARVILHLNGQIMADMVVDVFHATTYNRPNYAFERTATGQWWRAAREGNDSTLGARPSGPHAAAQRER